jgi:hypothetical protein
MTKETKSALFALALVLFLGLCISGIAASVSVPDVRIEGVDHGSGESFEASVKF